ARVLVDKLLEAINKSGTHRYSVSRGIRKFRVALAERYRTLFQVACDPSTEVCSTLGSKDAIQQILQVLQSEGCQKVLLPSPCYPAHLTSVELCRMQPHFFRLSDNEDEMLASIEKQFSDNFIQVLIINFPNNPTGQVVTRDFYNRLVALAHEYHVMIVNDFVYGEMSFDRTPCTSLLAAENAKSCCVEVYSMSKAFCVPGWRMGAVLGNEQLVGKVARLKSLVDYGTYLPLQLAAASALSEHEDLVGSVVAIYKRRLQIVESMCQRLDLQYCIPAAGCSLWLRLPGDCYGRGAKEFCLDLLRNHGVCLLPGNVFGEGNSSWIRVALVASEERLQSLADKLAMEIHAYERAA
ncbi:MAG: aminotransferase class I/II-fold pyridoxal phosphate-dependent enzyme, partial [Bdellovibrionales bacterium]|nr:aminotransferase class I/II-fold pyridoxal phosphate-dependent enzyme [Bdellovibrionales bacterium]